MRWVESNQSVYTHSHINHYYQYSCSSVFSVYIINGSFVSLIICPQNGFLFVYRVLFYFLFIYLSFDLSQLGLFLLHRWFKIFSYSLCSCKIYSVEHAVGSHGRRIYAKTWNIFCLSWKSWVSKRDPMRVFTSKSGRFFVRIEIILRDYWRRGDAV